MLRGSFFGVRLFDMAEGITGNEKTPEHDQIAPEIEAKIARAIEDVDDANDIVIKLYDADDNAIATVPDNPANRRYYFRDYVVAAPSSIDVVNQESLPATDPLQEQPPPATPENAEPVAPAVEQPAQPAAPAARTFTLGAGQGPPSAQRQVPAAKAEAVKPKERYKGPALPEGGTAFADESAKKTAFDEISKGIDELDKLGGYDILSLREQAAKMNTVEAETFLKNEIEELKKLA